NFTQFAAFEGYNLREKDRSFVLGCFEDYYIRPNSHLIKMTDYEIMIAGDDILKEIIEFIRILNVRYDLLSKKDLQDKNVIKYKRFTTVVDRFSKFTDIDKFLYSGQNSSSFYKAAILLKDGNGIKYDNMTDLRANFNFEKITTSEYISNCNALEFEKVFDTTNPVISQIYTILTKYVI
ncbi:MAG TPA: hypothetical protein PJ990_18740, partial [Saprospiraceae bacterium]|nr:hypothetical protein [Saprospiraceae bacterium]